MELPINQIINGDALEVLKTLPDESIDCCISSPPYWALRSYLPDNHIDKPKELGLEENFNDYIKKLCDIYNEVFRVLKKSGTGWVNLNDTYYTKSGSNFEHDLMAGDKAKISGLDKANSLRGKGLLKDKCLCLIPERFVIEMCSRNWILRNRICWFKRNAMPTSVKDRLANRWEYVFFFVKNRKYFFDLDAIRKPYKETSLERFKRGITDSSAFNYRVREACKGTLQSKFGQMYKASPEEIEKYGSPRAREFRKGRKGNNPELNNRNFMPTKNKEREFDGRWGNDGKGMAMPKKWISINTLGGNPGDHWDITTKGHPFAHWAVYPEELCEIPIRAGCPKDGIVLDPFIGSGTTGLVALKLNRKFIGIELNKSYCNIAMERLKPFLEQAKLKL